VQWDFEGIFCQRGERANNGDIESRHLSSSAHPRRVHFGWRLEEIEIVIVVWLEEIRGGSASVVREQRVRLAFSPLSFVSCPQASVLLMPSCPSNVSALARPTTPP
jgi:hypothetical protein